jgi:hypothetical protein
MFEANEASDGPDPSAAVIAHALISSAAVIANAIQSVIAYGEEFPAEQRRQLLDMALTQAQYVIEVLKDLARGLPAEVIDVLDAINERRPIPD